MSISPLVSKQIKWFRCLVRGEDVVKVLRSILIFLLKVRIVEEEVY